MRERWGSRHTVSYSFKYFRILCWYQRKFYYSVQGIIAFDIADNWAPFYVTASVRWSSRPACPSRLAHGRLLCAVGRRFLDYATVVSLGRTHESGSANLAAALHACPRCSRCLPARRWPRSQALHSLTRSFTARCNGKLEKINGRDVALPKRGNITLFISEESVSISLI